MRWLIFPAALFLCGCEPADLGQRDIACHGPFASQIRNDAPRTPGLWRDEWGQNVEVTRYFADDPERVVIWSQFRWIIEGDRSAWRGPYGLALGMNSREVQTLNRDAYDIFVSDDRSILVTKVWRRGRLSHFADCHTFAIFFKARNPGALATLEGGRAHAYNEPALRDADLYVSRIDFGYIPGE